MKQVYLLTGGPGVGKTTIIKQALTGVEGGAGGFYSEEIRAQGRRQGFRIITLGGESAVLAHVNIQSPYRVGKYGVDLAGLDKVAVPALRKAIQEYDIVVIDEIGRMELLSTSFREAVAAALNSGKRVLGTIMINPHPWADQIKENPRVELIQVTMTNRRQVAEQVLSWLKFL